jgi:hypothetical protein
MKIVGGDRPSRPTTELCTNALWPLITSCWTHDPKARPSMTNTLLRLRGGRDSGVQLSALQPRCLTLVREVSSADHALDETKRMNFVRSTVDARPSLGLPKRSAKPDRRRHSAKSENPGAQYSAPTKRRRIGSSPARMVTVLEDLSAPVFTPASPPLPAPAEAGSLMCSACVSYVVDSASQGAAIPRLIPCPIRG